MKRQMGVAVLLAVMLAGCKKESPAPVEGPSEAESGRPIPETVPVMGPVAQTQPVIPDRPASTGPSHQPEGVIWDDFTPPVDPVGRVDIPVTTRPGVATTQPEQVVHVVKKGDSLYSIARDHYGNGEYYTDILAANPGLTTDLTIGQKIILPAIPDAPATTRRSSLPEWPSGVPIPPGVYQSGKEEIPGANPQHVVATQPGQTVYIVKKGDSLYSIAQEHYGNGEKYKEILATNPGLTKDLHVGQEIILPPAGAGQ